MSADFWNKILADHAAASLRGDGWTRDCPKCVGSKFVCDVHNPNAKRDARREERA